MVEPPGNEWPALGAPNLGAWAPSLRVSVIIPHYEREAALRLVLSALGEQTYPHDLIEIVVADDGSAVLPDVGGLDPLPPTRVVAQSNEGFRLAEARNLGARASHGDILIFLDGDMIPSRHFVEAHARWHTVCDHAVTIGRRIHADLSEADPASVRAAVAADTMAALAGDRVFGSPQWIADHLTASADLTRPPWDMYRVTSGGNLGLRRTLFDEAGGFDPGFRQWGGEDNEFGYRLGQLGAVVVPEPAALCWHDGEGRAPSSAERRSQEEQRPRLRNLIADPGFRKPQPGRSYLRPAVVVRVDASGSPIEQIHRCVGAILANSFHDLVVAVSGIEGDDVEPVRREYAADPRVHLGAAPADTERFSWLLVDIPIGAAVRRGLIAALVRELHGSGAATAVVHDPDGSPPIVAVTTRALALAGRQTAGGDGVFAHARSRYGTVTIDGEALAATDIDPEAAHAENLALRLELAAVKQRRVLRLVDAVATGVRRMVTRKAKTDPPEAAP